MLRLRRALVRQRDEEGFTLIELLVVIIIIGILAAIAIPVFLNQRTKAADAAAKSDLRNLANFEEIYLNDFSTYGTIAAVAASEPQLGISKGDTLTVVRYDHANGYCLSATNSSGSGTFYYDSQGGGLQPKNTPCPKTTAGTAGGSLVSP